MAVILRHDVDELKKRNDEIDKIISVKKNAQGTITEMKLFGKKVKFDETYGLIEDTSSSAQ